VVSAASLIVFVVKTLQDRYPIVDLNVFKFRSFSIGSFLGIIMGFGLYGTALILPLFFQSILGFTAFDTGMALMPGAFATRRFNADHRPDSQSHRTGAGRSSSGHSSLPGLPGSWAA